jgi:hypothetical protein
LRDWREDERFWRQQLKSGGSKREAPLKEMAACHSWFPASRRSLLTVYFAAGIQVVLALS